VTVNSTALLNGVSACETSKQETLKAFQQLERVDE